MPEVESTPSVTGKRRRDESSQTPVESSPTIKLKAHENSAETIAPAPKRQKKASRTQTKPVDPSSAATAPKRLNSERAKRAERRASLDRKRTFWGTPSVAKALKEYEAVQAAMIQQKKARVVSPSTNTDTLTRRLSNIDEEIESGKSQSPVPASVEDSVDSPTAPNYYRLGSLVSGPQDNDDDEDEDGDAPLANFTKRLSSAALVLANNANQTPVSEDSDETGKIPRNEASTVSATAAAQAEVSSNIFEMMQRMVQDHEETRKATEELLLANRLEAQRLETLIATQLPSAPPLADSRREVEIWNHIAYESQRYGAIQAFATYSKLLCGDNLEMYNQIMQPLVDAPQADLLKLMNEIQNIQPQAHPDFFYSARSRIPHKLRNRPGYYTSREEMSRRLAQELGGVKNREAKPSRYPLVEMLTREQQEKERQNQTHIQTVFLKATVANTPNLGQQIVFHDRADRKDSWAMNDADDTEYDRARNCRPPQQAPQATSAAQSSSSNVKVCPFFVKDSCKFGDGCKMSHDKPGATSHDKPSASTNTGPPSTKTKQLNKDLKTIEWYLGKAVDMSYNELGYNDHVNSLVAIINNGTTEITSTLAFSSSNEVLQSTFNTPVTQALEKIMNIWWAQISPTVAMPLPLFDAVMKLGRMVNYADNRIGHPPSFSKEST
ncbi:hypothetical protein CC86DRAFT_419424 [Ophiobolus disseminans]|uniref:C3H1-type domain-containing protein n=1 Tax=Ophiobolus disseminans TaxID=1469910 RepID=A0A6A6ZY27_9PLEO|nr:hypothetical protein CC86DRAFT_419424 [Ophiobolus disseminans]